MLRITALSLLLGALALIAGLTLFFAPMSEPDGQTPSILWNADSVRIERGVASRKDGELLLELDGTRLGTVHLNFGTINASAYPFLHLALEETPEDLNVGIFWTNSDNEQHRYSYILPSEPQDSLWLATSELKGWTGDISDLSLYFFGKAGETVLIRDFSLLRASMKHQLSAIYSDLKSYESWNRAAMNTYAGATPVSSFYPVPLVVAYLGLCLLAYGLLLVVFRARLTLNWQIVALLFLACWVILDLVWQNRLLHQVADTHRTFAGKNSHEKRAVGPDAAVFNFITRAKPLLAPRDARVFVSSDDEYRGQRAAYFLYPFNVFWHEPGRLFPYNIYLHPGDYIVLIQPTTMRFVPWKKTLIISPGQHIGAERVFEDRIGTVVRIN